MICPQPKSLTTPVLGLSQANLLQFDWQDSNQDMPAPLSRRALAASAGPSWGGDAGPQGGSSRAGPARDPPEASGAHSGQWPRALPGPPTPPCPGIESLGALSSGKWKRPSWGALPVQNLGECSVGGRKKLIDPVRETPKLASIRWPLTQTPTP